MALFNTLFQTYLVLNATLVISIPNFAVSLVRCVTANNSRTVWLHSYFEIRNSHFYHDLNVYIMSGMLSIKIIPELQVQHRRFSHVRNSL